MIQTLMRLCGVVVVAAAMAACGTADKAPASAATVHTPKYSQAYVSGIEVSLLDSAPDDKRLEDKKTLEMKLPTVVSQKLTSEGLKANAADPGAKDGMVRLNVTVKYDPGNRALRWVGGLFGAGKGSLFVQVDALDAVTGKTVASEQISDTKRGGFGGGDFYEFITDSVEDAIEEVVEKVSAVPQTGA